MTDMKAALDGALDALDEARQERERWRLWAHYLAVVCAQRSGNPNHKNADFWIKKAQREAMIP